MDDADSDAAPEYKNKNQNKKGITCAYERAQAMSFCILTYINSDFDTYNSLTPNWYYKVLR